MRTKRVSTMPRSICGKKTEVGEDRGITDRQKKPETQQGNLQGSKATNPENLGLWDLVLREDNQKPGNYGQS